MTRVPTYAEQEAIMCNHPGHAYGPRDCPACKTVNCDTQPGVGLADTSNNREAIPQPTSEQANMFKIEKTNYVVTAALFFALICAVIQ